jgi:outer membrane receptor protein involved in Fe transport
MGNTWILNDTFSNEMTFDEDIHSVYSTFSGSLAGINYMLGLRGEYTNRIVDQKTSNEYFNLERYDFFPSVHFSKTLAKEQELQLSYSRRIERPRHWYLNPYPGYSDAYSVRKGNPELLPEYIDSYEFSYQKRIKMSSVNAIAYFRQKNNTITQVQQLMDDGRFLFTFDNINKEYSYGAEISTNMQLAKMLMVYFNANVYRYNIESDFAGLTTDVKSYNYDFRMNLTMMFSKTSRIQINGFYNAPTVTAQGTREDFFMAGMAFRQDFFKRKLSATVNVRDILKTGVRKGFSEGVNFYTQDIMTPEAPVFSISLSYKINNYKQKNGDKEDAMNDEGMM